MERGTPCHVSKALLKEILRDRFGFEGLVMSDGNGVQLVKTFHEFCEHLEDTVPLTMNAGIELELDHMFKHYLKYLVLAGRVDLSVLNAAVAKVLMLKF